MSCLGLQMFTSRAATTRSSSLPLGHPLSHAQDSRTLRQPPQGRPVYLQDSYQVVYFTSKTATRLSNLPLRQLRGRLVYLYDSYQVEQFTSSTATTRSSNLLLGQKLGRLVVYLSRTATTMSANLPGRLVYLQDSHQVVQFTSRKVTRSSNLPLGQPLGRLVQHTRC